MNFKFLISFVFIILFSCSCNVLFGQKKEADSFFNQGQYSKALKFYNLYEKIDKRENSLLNRAICYYELNRPIKSLQDLSKIEGMGNKSQNLYKYKALALHVVGKYEDAAVYYKLYLRKLKNGAEYNETLKAIKQCGFARNYQYKERVGLADNLGQRLNTKNDEERVVESYNYTNRIYFTSNRKEAFDSQDTENGVIYHDELEQATKDIFYSNEVGGKWSEVEGFNIFLNTSKNEKLHDFSKDGRIVFFQSGTRKTDDWLLVDTAKEVRSEIRPSKLECPINMAVGDTDVKVVNDTLILFASNAIPGYGGYDIFFTTRNDEGTWTRPVNFGPSINGPYDDRSPFLSKSGKRLYFSSNRVESFGGLDVFSSTFEADKWSSPVNIGFGINSTRDDLDFRLVRNGNLGYLTSDRVEGYGGLDIYQLTMTRPDPAGNNGSLDLSFIKTYDREAEESEEVVSFWEIQDSIAASEIPDENSEEIIVDSEEKRVEEEFIVEPEMQNFEIGPLYYDEDEFLKSSENKTMLKKLAEIYKMDPYVQIVLVSHSLEEDDVAFDLFLSAKRGERMLKEFKKNGISLNNVRLLGVGSNYPLVKSILNGDKVDLADKLNRRFDVFVYPSLESYVEVENLEPAVKAHLRDVRYDAFTRASEGLIYKVKVEESSKILSNNSFNNLQDLMIEKTGKKYTYTLGLFKTFDEAKSLYDALAEESLKALDIRVYFNNILVSENDIPLKTRIFPDLENYLNFRAEQ